MNILHIKAVLLAVSYLSIDSSIDMPQYNNTGNLAHDKWIFLKLNHNSRVRMVLSDDSPLRLCKDIHNGIYIYDYPSKKILVDHIEIEEPIVHAPQQMFFTLYRKCIRGCRFCPLTYSNENIHHSLDDILGRIAKSELPKSIGITTSSPPNLDSQDIVDEICFVAKKIKKKFGDNIPIGASMNFPKHTDIKNLKNAGISELRLNIETPNEDLAKLIMPNKPLQEVYHSIEIASKILGPGKVTSNIILGLGESDSDVKLGIEKLASIGAIATLYPYDSLKKRNSVVKQFIRPSYQRIHDLALIHKKLLKEYSLNPCDLKTMCGSCAASHILPFRDF